MTVCAIKIKHWILRHYLWIAVVTFVLSIVAIVTFAKHAEWQIRLSILGVPFTLFYFVQKQKMEELEVFKSLFTKFNRRYDKLKDNLNAIRSAPAEGEFTDDERIVLFNYFNLCGEEYLFFSQGFVYPEVWAAWYNGMRIFYTKPRIKRLWDEELKTGSYYGLRLVGESCGDCLMRRFMGCSRHQTISINSKPENSK